MLLRKSRLSLLMWMRLGRHLSCTNLLLSLLASGPAINTSKVRMYLMLVGLGLIHFPPRFSLTCQARCLTNIMYVEWDNYVVNV